jgi:uracil-DNA glycosylase
MRSRIDRFVDNLVSIDLENVFNPYADKCEIHDLADGPGRRKRNLKNALRSAVENNTDSVWIARDLGYRGGRRTGLALTDEAHLANFSALHKNIRIQKATKGPVVSERTATVIWNMLGRISDPVFLWNVFPFHPHLANDPMSNRCHTSKELKACDHIFHDMLEIVRPSKVIAIGSNAHTSLEKKGIDGLCVRHPSYGGQNTFIDQIERAYGL